MIWTTSQFKAIGLALYGHGWQTRLASELGVSDRTVRRWAAGHRLPPTVQDQIMKLAGGANVADPDWPRDEWIIGEGQDERLYVIHTKTPRFIARVAQDHEDADRLTGISYDTLKGEILCEIVWIDRPPDGQDLNQLLAEADAATGF